MEKCFNNSGEESWGKSYYRAQEPDEYDGEDDNCFAGLRCKRCHDGFPSIQRYCQHGEDTSRYGAERYELRHGAKC